MKLSPHHIKPFDIKFGYFCCQNHNKSLSHFYHFLMSFPLLLLTYGLPNTFSYQNKNYCEFDVSLCFVLFSILSFK